VSVLTKQDEVKNIYDVYYVPNLKHNLLSVGKLMQHGYDVIFHNNICTIHDKSKNLVAKVQMTKHRLFPLEMRSVNMYAHNVTSTNKTSYGIFDMVTYHLKV
jgi:hypothetical protein